MHVRGPCTHLLDFIFKCITGDGLLLSVQGHIILLFFPLHKDSIFFLMA